jgi:hypothetical protein
VPAIRVGASGREGRRREMFWEGKILTEGKKERKCNIYPFINVLHLLSFFPSPTLLM